MPLPGYRQRRIVERLAELPQATLADMQQLQYDVVSLQARRMLELFLPHVADGPVRERLAAWDCRYSIDSLEATLFARLYRNVLLEIFGQAPNSNGGGIGWRRMLYLSSRAGYSTMVLTVIDRLLEKRAIRCGGSGRDKADLIRRAAGTACRRDRTSLGANERVSFREPLLSRPARRPRVGISQRRMAMPGCHATPFQGHLLTTAKRETSFAPSYHFVTDLGTDEAWTNLPGGPSESRFSPFYKNDLPRWQSGEYKRLRRFDDARTDRTWHRRRKRPAVSRGLRAVS